MASAQNAVVFDLDGVLADVRHRLHHVAGRPRDWEAFFAAAPDDPVLADGRRAVEAVPPDHAVVYLTGRPERCRADTQSWLVQHRLPRGELLMRPDWDRRPAWMTKVAHLRHLAGRVVITQVLDDDASVVEAVRAAGFPALHVTWMAPVSTSTSGSYLTERVRGLLFDLQEGEGRV